MHDKRAIHISDFNSGRWSLPIMTFLVCAGYVTGWGLLFLLHNSSGASNLLYMTIPGLLLLILFLLGWVLIPVTVAQTIRRNYSLSYWSFMLIGLSLLLALWHVVLLRQTYASHGVAGTDEVILNGSFHSHVDIMLRVLIVWGAMAVGVLLTAAIDGWNRYQYRFME